MSEVKILTSEQTITGWNKDITFERKGEKHIVRLFWNAETGYDLVFTDVNSSLFKPTWAEKEYDWTRSLEQLLDELTEVSLKTEEVV
jgi:hypothetical protein